jgi:hypothetical protein
MFSSPIEVMYQRVERKVAELQNELEQSDGLIQTSAMFDLDGNWVPAKMIETKYGFSWSILNENGKATGVFVPFHAKKRETQAKRGFVEGIVRVPATVTYAYAGNRPHAVIAPADQVGTVKPTVIIATDRFAQEVK